MKLIILNRHFFPDHSATSQLLMDLALHLVDVGHARFILLFVGGGNQRGPLGSEVARRALTNVLAILAMCAKNAWLAAALWARQEQIIKHVRLCEMNSRQDDGNLGPLCRK